MMYGTSSFHLEKELGLRVVRGPDWRYFNQDGGEGHVGTVAQRGTPGSFADKMVKVLWDSGSLDGYRAGFEGFYDLRIVDSALAGVSHLNITCGSCWKQNIAGMRWKCIECTNFDLCTRCYMADQHDLTHPFLRYETGYSSGVKMSSRQHSSKITKKGIFVSAKVISLTDKGPISQIGTVSEISSWLSGREEALVKWPSGEVDRYDIGYRGQVELKYTEAATDGCYYLYHLPILGKNGSGAARTKETKGCENTLKEKEKGSEIKTKKEDKVTKNSKSWELLSQNLETLFLGDQFCDFKVKVADREFQIHKAILGARSSVFASMLQHDMKEKNTGIVEISDCDPHTFEDFLFYLYSGKTERISHENATGLYELADKYDVQGLKVECIQLMKGSLSVDFICDAMTLAVRHGDKELIKTATEYFISNAKEILQTVKWQIFMKENSVTANELYIKAFNTASSKN